MEEKTKSQMEMKTKEADVLLIHPPLSVNERYARDVGDVGGDLPPLGLAMVAAVLKEKGFKVRIIDSIVMHLSNKDLIEIIRRNNPKVIGITAMTPSYPRAKEIAGIIKKEFPETLLLIGGHHVTIMPEDVLKESRYDIGIIGEGELTIIELLKLYKSMDYNYKKFLSSMKLESIDGIVFKNKKGRVILNKPRELISNLDELPYPARELLPMSKYLPLPNQYKRKPVVHMVAIRGCPYNCAFCSNNKLFGRGIRARSPEKVVEEIIYVMKKYNAREISFWDDMMTTSKEWVHKFCDIIIQNKIDITWTCYARVDSVDEAMLKKMKKAGCWNIFFGFESGVQELLDNIHKGITLKQIEEANALCKKYGIEVRASFMIALPGETPELARKTIEFAKKLNPDYVQFCITTPYPGTELYENAEKYGRLEKDFAKFSMWEPVFVPYGYRNQEEIKEIERKAMHEFYLRPEYIISRIKKINSIEDIFRYLKGLRFLLGFISNKK